MKRKAWKIVLGITATMGLLLGLVVGDAHRRASATLERYRLDLERKTAEFGARDRTRPAVYRETLEGNAWDHYGPAIAALLAVPQDLADLVPEIEGTVDPVEDPPDDHALHNLFREYAGHVEALERGARCRRVELPGFSLDPAARLPASEAIRTARWVAGFVTHAHRLGRDGEGLAAARAGLAFGQDFGRTGLLIHALIQSLVESITAHSLRPVLESHGLSVSELSGFAEALDLLDASRPDMLDSFGGEELFAQHQLLNLPWKGFERNNAPLGGVLPSWKCLFSRDITRAQALGIALPRFEQALALRGLPPWERLASSPPSAKERESSGNMLADAVNVPPGMVSRRDAITRLVRALVRVSVAIAWYEGEQGRYPERLEDLAPRYLATVPVCPLTGSPLRTRGGKVWSVGVNRVDDGGVPGKNNDVEDPDGDVVWTVQRRK